jgi:hypothetical protein
MKNHHWLWLIGGVVVLYIVYAEWIKTGALAAVVQSSTAGGSAGAM